jgi:protein SCO1
VNGNVACLRRRAWLGACLTAVACVPLAAVAQKSTAPALKSGVMSATPALKAGVLSATPALKAGVFEPPRMAPEITLIGSDGRDFNLARHRGKLVLVAFGFTSCAAVCPVTLATLAQARNEMGPTAAADVQVVFVTVDPERDSADHMKRYLASFDATFIGATGTPDALARVRQAFGVTAVKVQTGDSYAVDHTSSVFLIDREGRLRALMPYGRPIKDYVHDARTLLSAP